VQRTAPTKTYIMTNLTHPTGWPHNDIHQIEMFTMLSIRFIRTVFPWSRNTDLQIPSKTFRKITCSGDP
jgi:hypothetical protein